MDEYLGLIGLLAFIFFLIATATEAILELFRRPLEWLKITPQKSRMTMEEAVRLSADFIPDGDTQKAKLDAIQAFVKTAGKNIKDKEAAISQLRSDIAAATDPTLKKMVSDKTIALFAEINELLDKDEDYRIRMLRLLSFVIALIICFATGTNAIDIVLQSGTDVLGSALKNWYVESADGTPVAKEWVNIFGLFLTAAASASGSSYWHDQLDKVRKLKSAQAQIGQLSSLRR